MTCNRGCNMCVGDDAGMTVHGADCCSGGMCNGGTAPFLGGDPITTTVTGSRNVTITWDVNTYTAPTRQWTDFTTYPSTTTYTTDIVNQAGEVVRTVTTGAPPTRERDADQRAYLEAMERDRRESRARRDEILAQIRATEIARYADEQTSRTASRAPEAKKVDTEKVARKRIAELMEQSKLEVEVKPQKEATPRERQAEF